MVDFQEVVAPEVEAVEILYMHEKCSKCFVESKKRGFERWKWVLTCLFAYWNLVEKKFFSFFRPKFWLGGRNICILGVKTHFQHFFWQFMKSVQNLEHFPYLGHAVKIESSHHRRVWTMVKITFFTDFYPQKDICLKIAKMVDFQEIVAPEAEALETFYRHEKCSKWIH